MSVLENKKRKFANNQPEILPLLKSLPDKRNFVVHRHLGSILHYDLRIEINGMLKSWAIPKGPSMNVGDRRLAVMTEDYPLSYSNFKGIVPEGNYGAGIIEIWDKGLCIPHATYSTRCSEKDLLCQLKEGRLKFTLKGKKLKGVFSLVRIDQSGKHWILIKGNDKYAVDHPYNCEEYINVNSPINRMLKNYQQGGGAYV